MNQLLHIFIAFVLCILFVSPQAHACMGPGAESTLFFNASAQPLIFEDLGQAPSTAEGMAELPPDADVIAEVVLTGNNSARDRMPTAANIVRVIKTSDARVRQGEEITIKFGYTSCGPNHRSGNKGTIAAKIGTDIEDQLVLCLYSRRFSDGHINSPTGAFLPVSECNPGELKVAKRIKRAAEKGDVKAQTALGSMYEKGENVRPDNEKAMKWFHLAAASGDADAQYEIGKKYKRDKNNKEAMKWFKLAAEKGNKYAKNAIEKIQEDEAVRCAAEKGDAEAQYKLGYKYYNEIKYVEALKWYKLAAVQGHLKAANSLGWIYHYGSGGVGIDHKEAIKWYLIAAEKGDAEAQHGLGSQYEFLYQYKTALDWYRLAADQGNSRAIERINVLLQYGRVTDTGKYE